MTRTTEMTTNAAKDNGKRDGEIVQASAARREIAVISDSGPFANLLDSNKFDHLWRVAQLFASSDMVPAHFHDKTADCFIVCQMAIRLGVDPFMMLQNTYVFKGKPGMEGKLAIALINSSGLFQGPLRFETSGQGDGRGCVAWAISKQTNERIEGPRVTIAMAKSEGWYAQNSKWRSIPDLMLLYRSGAWFGRSQCPERLMGMQTIDELRDESGAVESGAPSAPAVNRTESVLKKITSRPVSEGQAFVPEPAAIEQAERETPDVANPIQQNDGAEEQQPPDVSGADAEPPARESAEPDLAGTHEQFIEALRADAMDLGLPEAHLMAGLKTAILGARAKGKEDAISPGVRRTWRAAFQKGEGYWRRDEKRQGD